MNNLTSLEHVEHESRSQEKAPGEALFAAAYGDNGVDGFSKALKAEKPSNSLIADQRRDDQQHDEQQRTLVFSNIFQDRAEPGKIKDTNPANSGSGEALLGESKLESNLESARAKALKFFNGSEDQRRTWESSMQSDIHLGHPGWSLFWQTVDGSSQHDLAASLTEAEKKDYYNYLGRYD